MIWTVQINIIFNDDNHISLYMGYLLYATVWFKNCTHSLLTVLNKNIHRYRWYILLSQGHYYDWVYIKRMR